MPTPASPGDTCRPSHESATSDGAEFAANAAAPAIPTPAPTSVTVRRQPGPPRNNSVPVLPLTPTPRCGRAGCGAARTSSQFGQWSGGEARLVQLGLEARECGLDLHRVPAASVDHVDGAVAQTMRHRLRPDHEVGL